MAGLAYQFLHAKGYRNMKVLDEGIPGWIQQGQATEGAVSNHVPDHERDYAAMARMLSGLPAGTPRATSR